MPLALRSVAGAPARASFGAPCSIARLHSSSAPRTRLRAEGTESAVDLEAQLEKFMQKQAEIESGAAFVRARDPNAVIGADVVPDEDAKAYCREIVAALQLLKRTRDMSVNEIRLIVSIEDPRAKEMRAIGVEDERGVSRDEMASALMDVAEGRIPKDRIALKCLRDEVAGWPFLQVDQSNSASAAAQAPPAEASAASGGASSSYANLMGGDTIVRPYIMGKEARAKEGEKPGGLADMLPDWVGYTTLYGISAIPLMLGLGAVLVLFYNSLK